MGVKAVETLTKDGATVGKDSVFRVESGSKGRKMERCSVMRQKIFRRLLRSTSGKVWEGREKCEAGWRQRTCKVAPEKVEQWEK